jgi:SAM-dependent methyltransferase
VADGTRLPFAGDDFDTVACYDVLEHVVDPQAFLYEMGRVAKTRVVVAGPNFAGSRMGGLNRYLPLRLWTYLFAPDQGCPVREDPHLRFDDDWWPDRDALCAPNAGWVAAQLSSAGFRIRQLRSWEWEYPWLNAIPALRCLGPFMYVVGEKR